MIDIKDKKDCCGCEACKQICPRKCISMVYDTEGYLYPSVNKNECIDCSLCEKVCPVLSKKVNREPIHVYAAQSNDNNIVKDSSSGGIFSEISLKILEDNYTYTSGSYALCFEWNRKNLKSQTGT